MAKLPPNNGSQAKPVVTARTPSDEKPTLGSLLHGLRQRKGWTLKQMSEHTGIPFSTLSKVEHDKLTLTFDKLQQLSERLGLKMSELFSEIEPAEESMAVTGRRSVGTVENALQITTDNYDYFYLCTELRRKRFIPILSKIRAKTVDEFGPLVHHSGEEWFYVLEGEVEVHTEFYDKVVLKPGQSIYFDSNMGHAYLVADGFDEATVIGVCSSAEEEHFHELLNAHSKEEAEPVLGAAVVTPIRRRARA